FATCVRQHWTDHRPQTNRAKRASNVAHLCGLALVQSFNHDLVDLRRTYITMVMYACVDPFLVQRLAGHSNSSITAADRCGALRWNACRSVNRTGMTSALQFLVDRSVAGRSDHLAQPIPDHGP
ncbi:MAG: hypothetical protein F4Z18_01605, partial [Caldilineaceae bacterium SB0666_bin_21]|nr:hypothetical protein [Caldilineaceae bacterium SB0666_bin_21]